MKKSLARPGSSKLSGFTLVELLVVMAIIAILASVILFGGGGAIRAAKRAKAANMATQLQTAALGYYTEYSIYPDDTTAFPAGTDYVIKDNDAANWKNLLVALCGNINPATGVAATSTVSNTRGIPFLSLKTTEVDANVGPLNPLPPDTTHLYFNIAIDNDYNGVLGIAASSAVTTMPNFGTGTMTSLTLSGGSSTAGIAVWANCTTKPDNTSCNSSWWVHTY